MIDRIIKGVSAYFKAELLLAFIFLILLGITYLLTVL